MSVSKAHARLATQVKKHNQHAGVATAEAVQDARRELAAEKMAEHIRRTVDAAPPGFSAPQGTPQILVGVGSRALSL